MIPFIAIGNNELKGPLKKKGDEVICAGVRKKEKHIVKCGINNKN